MKKVHDCIFCNEEKIKNKFPNSSDCKRCIYEDKYCFAVLAPEQYTIGHTLVITKNHIEGITDNIYPEEFSQFIRGISHVAKLLKNSIKNEIDKSPENVYVNILCDGEIYIHAHLIPRYPFTEDDKNKYRAIFKKRDGEILEQNIAAENIGGFWYLAEKEINWKNTIYGKKSDEEKIIFLEDLKTKILNKQ